MGCWNATCGVSHLPIRQGEEVKAYILIPHWFEERDDNAQMHPREVDKFAGSGICYSHDAYSPLGLPITGKYNDYGSLEDIVVDQNAKYILEWFNKTYGKALTDVKDMIDEISQDGGELALGLMMIHSSIYDASINALESSRDPESDRDYMMFSIMQDFESAKEYLQTELSRESLMQGLKTIGIKSADDEVKDFRLSMGLGRRLWPKREGAHFTAVEAFDGSSFREGYMNVGFARKYFEKLLKAHTSVQTMVEHYMFCNFMQTARRAWITTSGNGSQCTEYIIHRMVADAVLAHVEQKKQQHMEDTDTTDPAEAEYMKRLF